MGGTIFSHPPYRLLHFFIFCSIVVGSKEDPLVKHRLSQIFSLKPSLRTSQRVSSCQERGVTKSEPSPPHRRRMGGEGATPLTAPCSAEKGEEEVGRGGAAGR